MTGLYLNSAWELLFYLILSCLLGLGFAALRRSQRLPFGSIDETVRTDGSYLIVYVPGTGAVRAYQRSPKT